MSHKRIWTIAKVKSGIELFKKEYGRYPVSHDFDVVTYLPSARHVQRIFGGLVELRKKIKTKSPDNFSIGLQSTHRALKIINKRNASHKAVQKELQNNLINTNIGCNIPICTGRSCINFRLSNEAQNCAVEAVYAKDDRVLIGCIDSRLKKYAGVKIEIKNIFIVATNKKLNKNNFNRISSRKSKDGKVIVHVCLLNDLLPELRKRGFN